MNTTVERLACGSGVQSVEEPLRRCVYVTEIVLSFAVVHFRRERALI